MGVGGGGGGGARHGKARQGKARYDKAGQEKTGQSRKREERKILLTTFVAKSLNVNIDFTFTLTSSLVRPNSFTTGSTRKGKLTFSVMR